MSLTPELIDRLKDDPVLFTRMCWPEVRLYRQQREIMYSVRDNDETFCPAGNALGKDFVAALVALWWFCTRRPARVVTTSVKMDQLEDVLWGEMRRFINTSAVKLPIQYNHMRCRQLKDDGTPVPNAELVGQVSNTQEGLLGRHSTESFKASQDLTPRTLVIFDEASGINDATYNGTQTWAHRKLIIGNPFPCENFFKRGVNGGDVPRDPVPGHHPPTGLSLGGGDSGVPAPLGYHRRVIRITAEDSPNVRLARAEIAAGQVPTGRILVPGVKSWDKLCQDRRLWDPILQKVGLDAEFYEGSEILLFPPDWLQRADRIWQSLKGKPRTAKAIGCDPGEGGAHSSWCIGDELGVMEIISAKTPDTTVIPSTSIALMERWHVPADKFVMDRGGGGKQHADALATMGYPIRTMAFGESIMLEPKRGLTRIEERKDVKAEHYAYVNRRSQIYGLLSTLLDPARDQHPWQEGPHTFPSFALPSSQRSIDDCPYARLTHQLSKFPRRYDGEGRLKLPPKNRITGQRVTEQKTLTEMIGHSPDEADAVVLMLHALTTKSRRAVAGAVGSTT